MSKPIYPYILAAIPPLALLAVNIQQVHSLAAWRLVLGSMILAAIIWNVVLSCTNLYKFIHRLTRPLNVAALCMLAVPTLIIGWYGIPRDYQTSPEHPQAIGPDYYFIVLDSYTSQDVLQDRFGYDNSPFINGLINLGFSVGSCTSQAAHTEQSLAAMLNDQPPEGPAWEAIYHSQLRADLEARGYSTWAFATGFVWTEILDADRFYQLHAGLLSPPTEFETLYLMQTPLKYILNGSRFVGDRHRAHTAHLLAHLADAARDPYSQFVFAHIIQPHPPFVYAANGDPIDAPVYGLWWETPGLDYDAGYIGQVQYINAAILPVLAEIIQTSAEPPTIILTGDHGPWHPTTPQEAFQIICARYGY